MYQLKNRNSTTPTTCANIFVDEKLYSLVANPSNSILNLHEKQSVQGCNGTAFQRNTYYLSKHKSKPRTSSIHTIVLSYESIHERIFQIDPYFVKSFSVELKLNRVSSQLVVPDTLNSFVSR